MLGRDHALLGALGGLAVSPWLASQFGRPHLSPGQLAAAGAVSAGFALLPDLDEPGSTISRKFGLSGQAAATVVHGAAGGHRKATHSLLAAGAVGYGFTVLGHCAWAIPVTVAVCTAVVLRLVLPLHLPKGSATALAVPLLAGWATWHSEMGMWRLASHAHLLHQWGWLGAVAGAGICWHLIGDVLTKEGVPLLWPLPWRLALPLVGHTDSKRERALGALMSVGVVAVAYVDVLRPALAHG